MSEPMDERDTKLRSAFAELRAHDQSTAPPFASVWGRPARPRRSALLWMVPLGATAAALLVWLAIGPVAPPAPPPTAASTPELVGIRDPEPLAFLLERPAGGAP
jgi:hypothetical protein